MSYILFNFCLYNFFYILAVCSAILTHLHVLKIKNNIQNWYDNAQLDCSSRFGLAFFAVGTSGLVYHIAKEVMLKTRNNTQLKNNSKINKHNTF